MITFNYLAEDCLKNDFNLYDLFEDIGLKDKLEITSYLATGSVQFTVDPFAVVIEFIPSGSYPINGWTPCENITERTVDYLTAQTKEWGASKEATDTLLANIDSVLTKYIQWMQAKTTEPLTISTGNLDQSIQSSLVGMEYQLGGIIDVSITVIKFIPLELPTAHI